MATAVGRPVAVACMLLFMPLLAGFTCDQQSEGRDEGVRDKRPMEERTIEAVLKAHTDRLMAFTGVVGTGIGGCEGRPCIKVYVVKATPELLNKIPREIEGYRVAVEETGEIKVRDSR